MNNRLKFIGESPISPLQVGSGWLFTKTNYVRIMGISMDEKLISEISQELKEISLGVKFVGTLGLYEKEHFNELEINSKLQNVSKLISKLAHLSAVHPAMKVMYRKACDLKLKLQLILSKDTKHFNEYSKALFADDVFYLESVAKTFDQIWSNYEKSKVCLNLSNEKVYTAKQISFYLKNELAEIFKDTFCIKLSSKLISKASCGKNYIKINKEKHYSESDLETFYIHEGQVHLLTNLNGKNQLDFFNIQCSKTTRTQEGLAIFSEFFTGVMTKARFENLKWRYMCCLMALKKQSQEEIMNYLIAHHVGQEEAKNLIKRVFRGIKDDQEQIFTKDLAYLLGFVEVYQFIEYSIQTRQFELMEMLYSVKGALVDITELKELKTLGLINKSKYTPTFFQDKTFVTQRLNQLNLLNEVIVPHREIDTEAVA